MQERMLVVSADCASPNSNTARFEPRCYLSDDNSESRPTRHRQDERAIGTSSDRRPFDLPRPISQRCSTGTDCIGCGPKTARVSLCGCNKGAKPLQASGYGTRGRARALPVPAPRTNSGRCGPVCTGIHTRGNQAGATGATTTPKFRGRTSRTRLPVRTEGRGLPKAKGNMHEAAISFLQPHAGAKGSA